VKLSARDKQRLSRALMKLIGGAAVLYASINLLILPLIQVRGTEMNKRGYFLEKIDTATHDLRDLAADKAEVAKLQAELDVATNRFVVRPVLGSTLVSVQNIVDPIAAACGLQIESYAEHGRTELPVDAKNAGIVIERYLVEVAVAGSYASVRDFVQAVETANEYVCVTEIEIVGRVESPAKHRIRISMEWPVFGVRKPVEPPPPVHRRAERAERAERGARAEEQP